MQKSYFVEEKNFLEILKNLSNVYNVFIPFKQDEQFVFKKFLPESANSISCDGYRQIDPLKSFIFNPRAKVLSYPSKSISKDEPQVVVGVKNCDLTSLKVMDYVFLGGPFEDPYYKRLRNSSLIISSDCTDAKDTCFCLGVGLKPYPEEGFDLNLSKVKGGFLITSGSDRGQDMIDKYYEFLTSAEPSHVAEAKRIRALVSEKVRDNLNLQPLPDRENLQALMRKRFYDHKLWETHAETCVECGACNFCCPACHCFLLVDKKGQPDIERHRIWDSCLYKAYALVAGGSNPRSRRFMRLRNRFAKKFDFFPEVLGRFGCTGCGRCIEACPGDIDIRKVLYSLKT